MCATSRKHRPPSPTLLRNWARKPCGYRAKARLMLSSMAEMPASSASALMLSDRVISLSHSAAASRHWEDRRMRTP